MISVAEILRQHRQTLQASPTPQLDAELLVAHGLEVNRADLFRDPTRRLSRTEKSTIDDLVSARRDGRSVAQIIGETEFYSIDIAINEHVLEPRADTEVLVDKGIEVIGERHATVIDIGTGSGAIAIALAKHCRNAQIFALDFSAKALDVAGSNVRRLKLPNLQLIRGDWLAAVANQCADVIISNPPYIESGDDHLFAIGTKFEPRLALDGGSDGLHAFKQIIPAAVRVLKSRGTIFLEHGYNQAESVSAMLEAAGFRGIESVRDLGGHNRVCVGCLA